MTTHPAPPFDPADDFAVERQAGTLVLRLALEQTPPDGLEVEVVEGVLCVRGQAHPGRTFEAGRRVRTFRLPEEADADGVRARVDAGHLVIEVPCVGGGGSSAG